jgi:carbohydrate kinase (thermoresistant glucokinase family)
MDSVFVRRSALFAVFVMGVSGSGKTTVAKALCAQLNCAFLEGDDFHPSSNREKMQSGTPLTDEDRLPWLRALNEAVKEKLQKKTESVVVACSALKETYRSLLTDGLEETDYAFVCLVGPKEVRRKSLFAIESWLMYCFGFECVFRG